ncbi:discoidin domain-containing protein [Cohnella silvisoli]|uniref:Discoidin domain-containing protein n=1 Tax=Cohnella silvisoli TaxID=2873699 RepID=A0ABV1KRM0_9BACL|nr:discoidin domain-containing protein [Cohnella silvisoli]MCD9022416.1 discoidin domain-containing protein [Cohnella silvisoli]
MKKVKFVYLLLAFTMVFSMFTWGNEHVGAEGTNLALFKTASASSIFSSAYSADKAIDGLNNKDDTENAWASANGQSTVNQWWKVDLGQTSNIGKVNVVFRSVNGIAYYVPKSITFQVSNDGTNWTTVISKSTNVPTEGSAYNSTPYTYTLNQSGRYVRLLFETGSQNILVELSEVDLNPANLALNKMASASSMFSSAYSAAKAVDGLDNKDDTENAWASANGQSTVNQWWRVDLGQTSNIGKVNVVFRSVNGIAYYVPKSITFQVSNDGTNWTTVISKSTNVPTEGSAYNSTPYTYTLNQSGRYVRLLFETGSQNILVELSEVEAYLRASSSAIPFYDTFDAGTLGVGWVADKDPRASISVSDGMLNITGPVNAYAHIERAIDDDNVRVGANLTTLDGGWSWGTGVALYWDKLNWVKITNYPYEGGLGGWYGAAGGGGKHYVEESIGGVVTSYNFAPSYGRQFRRLAIEIGVDCIRYLASNDGVKWTAIRTANRPSSLLGRAPSKFIIGRGYSDGAAYPGDDMDNSYAAVGSSATTYVKDSFIEYTPGSSLYLSDVEKNELAIWGRDWKGEDILSEPGDPTFDRVGSLFPKMKYSREIIGVKNSTQDIGVAFDGSLQFNNAITSDYSNPNIANVGIWEVTSAPSIRLGFEPGTVKKSLLNGLPIVTCTYDDFDGLQYEQTVYGASLNQSPTELVYAYSRMKVTNPGASSKTIGLRFRKNTTSVSADWSLVIPAGGSQSVYIKVPFTFASITKVDAIEYDFNYNYVRDYWTNLLSQGMTVNTPEQRVNEAYRAWRSYAFLNADGQNLFDGSGFYDMEYGYSAQHQIRALDQDGYHADADVYLRKSLSQVSPAGLYTENFGVADQGALLTSLAHHYKLTRDAAFMSYAKPIVVNMANWIKNTRAAQTGTGALHGLIYYAPYADHPAPAYAYFTDTSLCKGLEDAIEALQLAGYTADANLFVAEAADYRSDILASMNASVFVHDGFTYLPMFPQTHEAILASNYRADDYYGMNLSMVLDTNFLDPNSTLAQILINTLEKRGGLSLGALAWRGGIDHAYALGYLDNVMQRNETEKGVLGLYGWLAYGVSQDTYGGVEITNHLFGDNHPTLPHGFSNGEQMRLLQMMLLRTVGNELIVGQSIPRNWFEDGKTIQVQNAPSKFGPLSYTMSSNAASNKITVTLTPPTRNAPSSIKVKLRHPQSKSIVGVTVNGVTHTNFSGETITLQGLSGTTTLVANY